MNIFREKLDFPVKQKDSKKIWESLSRSFYPLIYGVKGDTREEAGLDYMDSSIYYRGDIFFSDTGQLMYYYVGGDNGLVEAGTVLSNNEGLQTFDGFKETITDAIEGAVASGNKWETIKEINEQYELIKKESRVLRADPIEKRAAAAMGNERMQDLLRRVRQKGSCFMDELSEYANDYDIQNMLTQLEELGLITREFYIFCRRNGQQISRVNSLKALEDARSHGFKCFSCGALISEEKISPHIKCSPLGTKFSRPNLWMALHIVNTLEQLGFESAQVNYIMEKDSEIFDLFVDYFGRFIMIELKDKPVQMKEVFMFLSRVKYYKPFRAILVTSHPVPIDVRLYLKNSCCRSVVLVEGLDNVGDFLLEAFLNKKEVYLETIFRRFNGQTDLPIDKLLIEKFFGGTETTHVRETSTIEIKIDADKTEQEELEKIVEFTEILPEADIEHEQDMGEDQEEEPATETIEMEIAGESLEETDFESSVEPPVQEPVESFEIIPAKEGEESEEEMEPEKEYEEEYREPAEETVSEIEEITGEGDLGQDLPEPHVFHTEQPHETPEDAGFEEAGDEESEYGMDFSESLPVEILPNEDISVDIDTSEEDLEKSAGLILNSYESYEISANLNLIESELSDISTIGFFSACLLDGDGLILSSRLEEGIDSEVLAAYSSVIASNIANSLMETGLDRLNSIHLEGRTGRVKIFPGGELIVTAYEKKNYGEIDDETGALPGETTLREAILQKVIDDLAKVEGIKGCLLAAGDGLLIESNVPENLEPNSIGCFAGQVVSLNEEFFNNLGVGSIGQILVKTDGMFYNLIPVESETIMVACLDPGMPREVWQNSLPQAAQMLRSVLS